MYGKSTPGTESKPSIKQVIHDHGSTWQKAEYGYQRKVWFKKKKVISAVYALRHILSVSETGALKQLEDQRKITPKVQGQGNMAIHEFVEKFLPRLDDNVHVSGKCKTEGGWRSITLTDSEFAAWQAYLTLVRSKFSVATTLL